VDTPVRLLVVDSNAANLHSFASLAEEEGIDVRTAVDATGAIRQCHLDYLDLVMISTDAETRSGASLLQTIRTLRPTVRAVLASGTQPPLRQLLRQMRDEPRHLL